MTIVLASLSTLAVYYSLCACSPWIINSVSILVCEYIWLVCWNKHSLCELYLTEDRRRSKRVLAAKTCCSFGCFNIVWIIIYFRHIYAKLVEYYMLLAILECMHTSMKLFKTFGPNTLFHLHYGTWPIFSRIASGF